MELKDYEVLQQENPEREIDDTNGWQIVKNYQATFWQEPCRHAVNVELTDHAYEAVLPNAVVVTSQCYVGGVICVDCLIEANK